MARPMPLAAPVTRAAAEPVAMAAEYRRRDEASPRAWAGPGTDACTQAKRSLSPPAWGCVTGRRSGYWIAMRSIAGNISESFPACPESVAQARHLVSGFAAAAGASERRIEDIRLASSEALTNAVRHAYRDEEGS